MKDSYANCSDASHRLAHWSALQQRYCGSSFDPLQTQPQYCHRFDLLRQGATKVGLATPLLRLGQTTPYI